MIEQEQLHTSPRLELYEAEVGHDRSWVTLGNRWSRKQNWQLKISQECWSRNFWKLSVENFTSCMRILKLTDTWEVLRDTRRLFCMEERQPRKDEFRERVGRIVERTLAGEARMERVGRSSQDGENLGRRSQDENIKRQNRWEKTSPREEKSSNWASMQWMCLRNRGNKNDEQMAVRHADASGGYIIENQHEEKRVRGIRVNKRGSRATSEEQLDEWKKAERLEHEAPNTSASSDPCVAQEYPVRGEIPSRPGPYLCRSQVVLTTTCELLRWMHSTERMDERVVTSEKCWSGIDEKMPEIWRELNWLRNGHVSMFPRKKFYKKW